jgi:hypothetical protein
MMMYNEEEEPTVLDWFWTPMEMGFSWIPVGSSIYSDLKWKTGGSIPMLSVLADMFNDPINAGIAFGDKPSLNTFGKVLFETLDSLTTAIRAPILNPMQEFSATFSKIGEKETEK